MKKTTKWKVFEENVRKYRIRAEYGFSQIGNQKPYFSITGEIYRHIARNVWTEDSFGMLHDEIAKHFPALIPLIKWHLVYFPCEPMNYKANALSWLEKHLGISKWETKSYEPNPLEAFKSTIVFGAIEDDSNGFEKMLVQCVESGNVKESLYTWLYSRLNALSQVFIEDMEHFGIELPE